MLPWVRWTAIFASSTSIWMNCSSSAKLGWIILRATYFSKPAMPFVLARWISAMPPTAICLTSRYGPNCRSATRYFLIERLGCWTLLQHLGAARMDEHADEPQWSFGSAVKRTHDLGRDSIRN